MPTVIALDVSLSMTRPIPHQPKAGGGSGDGGTDGSLTYHSVAVKGVNYILDYLTKHARLEFVSLIIYSSLYEVLVDFTRDYDSIRQALHKIEHYDKTSLENVLVAVNNAFKSHWGSQNYCQIVFITDCGVGMGPSSLKNTIINIQNYKAACAAALAAATAEGAKDATAGGSVAAAAAVLPQPSDNQWVGFAYPSKLSIVCLGSLATDSAFRCGTKLYQQLLDSSGQKGQLFVPRLRPDEPVPSVDDSVAPADNGCDDALTGAFRSQLTAASALETFETMCETNYRQFEATLRCGGYFRLEEPVVVWPAPLPYTARDVLGAETTKLMSRRLDVCGFVSLSDIGSPMSVSRHLILPRSAGGSASTAGEDGKVMKGSSLPSVEERLEADIKAFYAKADSDPAHHHHPQHYDEHGAGLEESVCVLLHGALKVENMAALVLLGDAWYGFIYSYADGKKKWNLMLNVLPPGSDVVPWLGDLRYLGTLEDALPGENPAFPIKAEKRSYSQNIVVWIRQAGLQSDIQKVLRHAKKLPEKTQHFYKELNRIRRAALSLGFVELLEGLAHIFEREIGTLPLSASPDCSMQLNHAAMELRKPANRDLKIVIHALPTQYNQLG